MYTTAKGMLKSLATRSVIAAIPVAMVTAYASNVFVPTPPRLAEYSIQPVAEITNSGSTIGIAASALSGQTATQIGAQLDEMLSIGVKNVRLLVPWFNIENAGPVTSDSPTWGLMDAVMTEAAKRNMGVLAEVNGTPNYAAVAGGLFPGTATPDPAKFTTFMQKFITRSITVGNVQTTYGSIVSAYEIWNEPNSWQFSTPIDPAAYANLLKTVYPVIKQLDPTSTVVAGAVGAGQTTLSTMSPVTFVQLMLDKGAGNYFDALSVHPYSQIIPFSGICSTCAPGILTPQEQVAAIKAMINGKNVWITEYGLPTVGGINGFGEQQQSDWIKDLLVYWKANPSQAGPIFLYTGRDLLGVSGDEGNFGLFKFDVATQKWVPKTAAEMLAALLNPTVVVPPDPTIPPIPVNPTLPVSTGNPVAGLAQVVQAFLQQITQVIQNFASLGQQFVTAIVTAITNVFRPVTAPVVSTLATPLALRVASVDTSVDTSEEPSFARMASTPDAGAAAKKGAVDLDEVDQAAAVAKGAELDAATATIEDPLVAGTPVEATPVVVTTPPVTTPVVKTPVVKTPEVTTPAGSSSNAFASTPDPDEKDANGSVPGVSTESNGDSNKSNADRSGLDTRDKDHGNATKDAKDAEDAEDEKDTKDAEDTKDPDADKQGPSPRHADGKEGKGFESHDAPKSANEGVPAEGAGATTTSVSAK